MPSERGCTFGSCHPRRRPVYREGRPLFPRPRGPFPLLEVGNLPIEAPIATAPPPQRLVLGPAYLARLGVHVAFELGRRASTDGAFGDRGGGGSRRFRRVPSSGGGSSALKPLEFGLLLCR